MFSSWDEALEAAGFDAAEIRLTRRWNRARVIETIRDAGRRGSVEFASDLVDLHPGIYRAARAYVGGWTQALREAGWPGPLGRTRQKWSLDIAAQWVRTRLEAGLPITAGYVPVGLWGRVCREVDGGWTAFVESLGVPYPGLRRRKDWTDEEVLAQIRRRHRRGLPLNVAAVKKDIGQALTHQARNRFGSWNAALGAAGVDPVGVWRKRSWTPADVIAGIRARSDAGRSLRYADAKADEPRLVKAGQRLFPSSWAKALAAAGLDPALARGARGGGTSRARAAGARPPRHK